MKEWIKRYSGRAKEDQRVRRGTTKSEGEDKRRRGKGREGGEGKESGMERTAK